MVGLNVVTPVPIPSMQKGILGNPIKPSPSTGGRIVGRGQRCGGGGGGWSRGSGRNGGGPPKKVMSADELDADLENLATESPGSNGPKTEDKVTDNPKIQAMGIYQGHSDTVEDVQFCPSSAQEFCSVGDDTGLILWDARTGSSAVVKV
ncbi:hypothetical protein LXL04_016220 [Taraxacum kok-saghyz]